MASSARHIASAARHIESEIRHGYFVGKQPKIARFTVVRDPPPFFKDSVIWRDPATGEVVKETFTVDANFPYQTGCLLEGA